MFKGMGAGVLISLEQYLAMDYSPDREFVDGVVLERHVEELPRSLVQRNLVLALCRRYPHLFVFTGTSCPDGGRTMPNPGRVRDVRAAFSRRPR